jgi:LysM repeat protein
MKNEHALLRKILGGERKRHRHHVTATVTEEGQWDQPEANNGLARMFVVMLLLHVVVIGAIVLYDFVGDEEGPKPSPGAVAASKSATPVRAVPLAPPAVAVAAQTATTPAASGVEFEIYEVRQGDTIASIITSLNVDRDEFMKMNSLVSDNIQIEPQSVLRVPKHKLPAQTGAALTANTTPAEMTVVSASDATPPTTETSAEGSTSAPNTVSMPIPLSPEELVASISTPKDEPAPAKTPAATFVQEKTPEPVKPKPLAMTQPRPVPTPSEMSKKPVVKNDPPAPAKKTDTAAKAAKKPAGKSSSYTLAKGDTLYRVATKTGVSVNDIIRANNIKDPAKLRDGTKLVIPAK